MTFVNNFSIIIVEVKATVNTEGVRIMKSEYYDGTKLLSMKDLNGRTPEIYLCTTNRTGGKTTYFGRLVVNRFLKQAKKFMLVYRYNYELDDVADKFFKDIKGLFFPEYDMISKKKAKGIYHELFLIKNNNVDNEIPCGYAVALNNADAIKKNSHFFSDTSCMLFDEFQSETNHYCPDEITKFISIHTSVARGQGEQVRYVPVYMLANQVSVINPYYTELDICTRLRLDTNFLRGDGFVLENGFIENASVAQKESGFNRAFKKNAYIGYASQNVYLNDNTAFVETPVGAKCRYLATLRYKGSEYAIKEYRELGFLYCDSKADKTFPMKISVTTDDHNINYVMLRNNDMFITQLRYYFEHGAFRFKDLKSKEALMKCITY